MQSTLEDFLREHVARLMSPDADPLPPCPRCAGVHISKKGYSRRDTGLLPAYLCDRCGHYFNRLSGTPLSHRPFRGQFDALVRLLPQSISCAQAANRLDVMSNTVIENVRLVRRWLIELDPSGQYERLVQLGGHLTAAHDGPYVPQAGVAYEDRELTRILTEDFDEVHSPRHQPLPLCPACNGRNTRSAGIVGLPRFRCKSCHAQFNRRTGTPFTRNRDAARQRHLIRYLPLPLPRIQLAAIIETDPSITGRLIDEFRRRCDHVDPTGQLAGRIHACALPEVDTPCVCCGARNVRFDPSDRGRCGTYGRLISMRRKVDEMDGLLRAGAWQGVAEPDTRDGG